jgi:hypothetical protein
MESASSISKPAQVIITLEDNALTPAMRRSINKARREYANGETISCSTPEEMQRYFDSL